MRQCPKCGKYYYNDKQCITCKYTFDDLDEVENTSHTSLHRLAELGNKNAKEKDRFAINTSMGGKKEKPIVVKNIADKPVGTRKGANNGMSDESLGGLLIAIGIITGILAFALIDNYTIVAIIWFIDMALILFGIGGILSDQPLSRDQEKLIEAQVKLLGQKVKAGESVDKLINDMSGTTKMREKEERNQIIKGAVKGGIIAGDAGAVVGAIVAKNKIDNERK